MKCHSILTSAVITLVAFAVSHALRADDRPLADETKPTVTEVKPDNAAAAKADTRKVRIIKPYSAMKDLTAEQTERMKEIHKKYLDQIKKLEDQQREELMAVLTEAQKKELAEIQAQERIERKVAAAKAKEKKGEAVGKTNDPVGTPK
jgi:hypothetical protein